MVFGDVFRDQRRVNVHSPFELVVSEGSFAVLLDEDDDRRENGEYDQEVKKQFFSIAQAHGGIGYRVKIRCSIHIRNGSSGVRRTFPVFYAAV